MKFNFRLPALSKSHVIVICMFIGPLLTACNGPATTKQDGTTDTLSENLMHEARNALKGLVVADGLEVTPMATEPMIKNPTNIDVDERGRIWVTEAYNYRPEINGNPVNPKGDRIVILEDLDGDGKTENSKVFYQGPELNAPLGICVLGNRVLVSQSPYVWAFYDDNNDDKADRKEVLFEGMGGEQHDHGMHTFVFGPDGKLYFNFGNEGQTLKDRNGKVVRDQDGEEIGPRKYKEGMVFRCDPDGSNVECLGNNFRNNYEVAVDSYGTMWQSDNDDDGNRGVRINYVMDYGNYGYKDEITGASWGANRTNIEDSIPLRHWHLNDPGVVPNLLQTGAGSPTGILIYEGSLLPERFHGQIIHCDAGPNVVRSYPVKKAGAGYTAEMVNIVKGEKDQWFRPADICIAPDGSLIIADWYDPGVGGHQAGDQQKGRIYRVAPPGKAYKVPQQEYGTPAGAVKALQSPNLATRYHAWTSLKSLGQAAVPELEKLWNSSADPRMRARAFWALVKMPEGRKYIASAIKQENADLRIMGLRAARELKADVTAVVTALVNDADPQVRRECALALRHNPAPEAATLWANLALRHDGKDRWYLEALGIGADRQWDRFFPAYASMVKDSLEGPASRDIIWRARSQKVVPYLAKFASDDRADLRSRLRYFRAFDFNEGPQKSALLLKMLEDNGGSSPEFNNNKTSLEKNKLVLHHLDAKTVKQSALAQKIMQNVLHALQGTSEYVELVRQYAVTSENANLLELAIAKNNDQLGRDAAGILLQQGGASLAKKELAGKDLARATQLLHALGHVGSKESIDLLQGVALNRSYDSSLRREAAEQFGRSMGGEDRALALLRAKKIPAALIPPMVEGVKHAWRRAVYTEASSFLPGSTAAAGKKKMPTINELLSLKSNSENGKAVFKKNCSVCHQVNGDGFDFGPKLTEIGSKLAKEGQLEAILHPDAGISFGYETWELDMKDGTRLTGILASKTETDLEIKFPGGTTQKIKTRDVRKMKEVPGSMMPAGLYEAMTNEEMADLIDYLSSLKKK